MTTRPPTEEKTSAPSRPGDSRSMIPQATHPGGGRLVYRNEVTGEEMKYVDVVRDPTTGRMRNVRAPKLSPAEQTRAVQTMQELAKHTEETYPSLTRMLLDNPDHLWLLPELQLMFQDGPNEPSYDLTAASIEAILEDPAAPGALANYQNQTRLNTTQQLFWKEVGDKFDEPGRDAFLTLLAQLDEAGADNVASLALAWSQSHSLEDDESKTQFVLNMHQWAYERQQSQLGEEGFFGALGAAQNFIEDLASSGVDLAIQTFGSPEEAARRRGLTLGQQLAYQMGIRPPDEAGEMGSWTLVSGITDGVAELGLDPLAWAGGVGAGTRAAKTIPLASKVSKSGRLAMASRALLPKPFTGAAKVHGGRTARVLYSFRAKTFDDLIAATAKNGVADDILKTVKEGSHAKFIQRYPSLARMPTEMWDAINISENGDEVAEVLRMGALNDALLTGDTLDDARKAAASAKAAYTSKLAEQGIEVGKREPLQDIIFKNPIVDRSLALDALNKANRADALASKPAQAFVIWDVPRKAKTFSWANAVRKAPLISESDGRAATAVRRVIGRATPGGVPDAIDMFDERKAPTQIRQFLEHYGVKQSRIDDVIDRFMSVELGARQDFFLESVLPELGEAIGVPALQYGLIQMYKAGGVRMFSSSGVDLWTDVVSEAHRGPILSSQFAAKIPLPIRELDEVVSRAQGFSNRRKVAKALGWKGRGIGQTNKKRTALVQEFANKLRAKGVDVSGLDDDALWNMAYSYVGDYATDGRGFFSGWLAPKAGSVNDKMQTFFKKMMLGTRPMQFALRVAVMEEPMRAYIWNLPSMYRNPLAWGADVRDAHYASKLKGWKVHNLQWATDTYRDLTAGVDNLPALENKLRSVGLWDDIFEEAPGSLSSAKAKVADFLDQAVQTRGGTKGLGVKVPRAISGRADKIDKIQSKLEAIGLPRDFDLIDDLPEIQGKYVQAFVGGMVKSSTNRPHFWRAEGLLDDEAVTYGRAYGGKIIEFLEDPFGKVALRRMAAKAMDAPLDKGLDVRAITEHSKWRLLGPEMRRRFPDAADDLELATRYMDEILEPEAAHLLQPFLNGRTADDQADILRGIADRRKLEIDLAGQTYDIDMSSGNYGKAVDDFGQLVRSQIPNSQTVQFPAEIPSLTFDPRFMAEDTRGVLTKMMDKVLEVSGERATQTISRRPAFLRQYERFYKNYIKIGVPEKQAAQLAREQAARLVNYVFYDIDEAPYYVQKLNRVVPFFGATWEVLSTWTYKMPVEVGGSWPMGVGEFGRKFQRLMDAFVNMGIVTREQDGDGSITHTVNFIPSDQNPDNRDIGQFFRGAGYKAIRTLEETISTIAGMEDGLALREGGYRFSVGHPLDFTDYGMLSFAQFQVGSSPVSNFLITKAAALYPGAADNSRLVATEGESLADLAERADSDFQEMLRLNRGVIIDNPEYGANVYNALRAGTLDPAEVKLTGEMVFEVPETSVWANVIADMFQPFGPVEDLREMGIAFIPGVLRWGLNGMALANSPTDEFWKDNEGYGGPFGGLLPDINQSQISAQLSEAFMYWEAHDIVDGKGPMARILAKQDRADQLMKEGKDEEANELRAEVELDTEDYLERVQRTAAESMLLRSLTGQMLPSAPGHVRAEEGIINDFWSSREYADSIRAKDGRTVIRPFKDAEEMENWYEMLGSWLGDSTGDDARARFAQMYPTLGAYLVPKTFYGDTGTPPEIDSFEEYNRQLRDGTREVAPLHVTMFRARSAAIQTDYYNKFVAEFGNNPLQAAANALQNIEMYDELQEERNRAYAALYLQDDMYGGVYQEWRKERQGTDNWSLETRQDFYETIRDNTSLLLDLEAQETLDMDLDGINGLRTALKGATAELSSAIRGIRDQADEDEFDKNPYEEAIFQYYEQIYIPYMEGLTSLYDEIDETYDSEAVSLVYEKIKLYRNEHSNSQFYLNDDTSVPFPSPMELQWNRRTPEEQQLKVRQWLTRPLMWIDQDSTQRIVERNPEMAPYLPTTDAHFGIYNDWTLGKVAIDEMEENLEITGGQATKMRKKLDEQMRARLIAEGRQGEVLFMDLTPLEKLELSGELPPSLGMFGDYVRYYQQILQAEEVSAGSQRGRVLVQPLYDMASQMAYGSPDVMDAFVTLGEDLFGKRTLDNIMPWLFFDMRGGI